MTLAAFTTFTCRAERHAKPVATSKSCCKSITPDYLQPPLELVHDLQRNIGLTDHHHNHLHASCAAISTCSWGIEVACGTQPWIVLQSRSTHDTMCRSSGPVHGTWQHKQNRCSRDLGRPSDLQATGTGTSRNLLDLIALVREAAPSKSCSLYTGLALQHVCPRGRVCSCAWSCGLRTPSLFSVTSAGSSTSPLAAAEHPQPPAGSPLMRAAPHGAWTLTAGSGIEHAQGWGSAKPPAQAQVTCISRGPPMRSRFF
jgi:hypothetical protein